MDIKHNGQALIVGDEQVNASVLDLYPNLKIIGCPMTGLDKIDLEECERRGIKVISLKGETEFLQNITSTSEHTVGLILALMRNYKIALNAPYLHRDQYMGHTLSGKTICLIGGAGRVGTQVRRVAESFGMKVYIVDTVIKDNWFLVWLGKKLGFQDNLFLNTALNNSDIVSVHIPLDGNEGFFTQEMFEQMKNTAYFINTSRSKAVEDGALIHALETKLIAGAAVDFTDEGELREYASENDNLILTNHIAGVTHEDRAKTEDFINKKVDQYINQLTKYNEN